MAKRRTVRMPVQGQRAITYPDPGADPAMRALEVAVLSAALAPARPGRPRNPGLDQLTAEVLARRAADRRTVERWKARRAAMAKRDRKVRRFWLGFGAVTGVAVLILLGVVGWWAWAVLGLGVLAIPALLGVAALLAVGGHRCITVVQHWH